MKLKTRERQLIEGLQIATGGSVVVSPLTDTIRDEDQPSNSKILWVFGGAISILLIGGAIGWAIATHFAQASTEKAQLAASVAKFDLAQNQTGIDNFCKANASPSLLK